MGIDWFPAYGDCDLGSAIEVAEKSIAKIKTNKFDKKKDLPELKNALIEIINALEKDEN